MRIIRKIIRGNNSKPQLIWSLNKPLGQRFFPSQSSPRSLNPRTVYEATFSHIHRYPSETLVNMEHMAQRDQKPRNPRPQSDLGQRHLKLNDLEPPPQKKCSRKVLYSILSTLIALASRIWLELRVQLLVGFGQERNFLPSRLPLFDVSKSIRSFVYYLILRSIWNRSNSPFVHRKEVQSFLVLDMLADSSLLYKRSATIENQRERERVA